MRVRQAKNGSNSGNYFLGCSAYPACKNTMEVADQAALGAAMGGAGGGRKAASSAAKAPRARSTASKSRTGAARS
jgi:ssDNA-binding Zn-finger/Zn-ribbon topoisomerase 1